MYGNIWGTIDWEDWSRFDKINISTDLGAGAARRNWRDTWKFAAGLQYRPWEPWLFQVGFAYDTSPTGESERTPDMPIDRQIRYAVGTQYQWHEKSSVGAEFV